VSVYKWPTTSTKYVPLLTPCSKHELSDAHVIFGKIWTIRIFKEQAMICKLCSNIENAFQHLRGINGGVPPWFLCCVILTPPTKHLCLKDDEIVLSNMVSYWLRKRSGSSEKGSRLVWLCAIAGLFPHMAQLLKQHFYWWNKLVSTRIASAIIIAEVEIVSMRLDTWLVFEVSS